VRHRGVRVFHFVHRRPHVRGRKGGPAGPCLPLASAGICNRPCRACIAPAVLTVRASCLQACAAAGDENPYRGLSGWLPWWTDKHLRMYYAKFCMLPPGESAVETRALITSLLTRVHARLHMRRCASVCVHAQRRCPHAHAHSHTRSRTRAHTGTVKLTPPSPETCYGAAIVVDNLTS